MEILRFLASYVADRAASIRRIDRILNQGLVTSTGDNLFAGRFAYLNTCGLSAEQVFDETLEMLFNAPGGGQLYVENLKGVTGEVALRLGAENEAFGVINVGDDAKLVKLCEENGLATGEHEFFGVALPRDQPAAFNGSPVDRFEEVHRGLEQLARLDDGPDERGKGRRRADHPALRARRAAQGLRSEPQAQRQNKNFPKVSSDRKHIEILETLGIFGIHADYMAQFRDFLDEEGLPTDDDRIEFPLPVIRNLGTQKLKTIRLKKMINGVSTELGDAFRKLAPVPTLAVPDPARDPSTEYLQRNQVVLNWYPKIQALKSGGLVGWRYKRRAKRNPPDVPPCGLS